MRTLGSTLKLIRTRKGLHIKEVATKSGVTISYISQLERDKKIPSLSIVLRFFESLDISPVLGIYLMNTNDERLPKDLHEKLSYSVFQAIDSEDNI